MMRFAPRLFAIWFACLCLTPLLVCGQSPGISQKAKLDKVEVALPDAYSGTPYNKKIVGALGLATGDIRCADPQPSLPDGITLTCTSELKLSGTPTTSTDIDVHSAIQVTDVLDHSVELDLTFTLRPATETVIVGGPRKLARPSSPPAPSDHENASFKQTIPIAEGVSTIAGFITPPLGKAAAAKLNVRAWIKADKQPEYLASLKPTGPASTTPVQLVPLGTDSTYTLTFLNALTAGETVRLVLVDADGKEVLQDEPKGIESAIRLNAVGLRLTSELIEGASAITGSVNMPIPAVPPDPKATPPTYGNYPQIVVWVKDADLGLWSEAPLSSSAGSTTSLSFQPVQPDGSFVLNLKNALKAGQEVRIDAVPPPGRSFSSVPPLLPPPHRAPSDSSQMAMVRSTAVLVQPSISTILTEGTVSLSGIATAPSVIPSLSVAVLLVTPEVEARHTTADEEVTAVCVTADSLTRYNDGHSHERELKLRGRLLPLTSSGSNLLLGSVDQNGGYKLVLAEALKEDDRIQIVQVLPAGTRLSRLQRDKCASTTQKVGYSFDWHRTNLTLVAGVLISNSSNTTTANANFSQANQFYSFNVDRAWQLPGVDCVGGSENDKKKNKEDLQGRAFGRSEYGPCRGVGWHASRAPGINTYFEGRLTSIPVSTPAADPTTSGVASPSGTSSLLTSQKVFRVSSGLFFPWVLGHGPGRHPNGIFFAPLAKAGFDTVTGAGSSPNVLLPGNTIGTLNYQTAYNFFAFGGRLGNMELSASHDRAPKIDHYIDVTIGRYSNLQSFICHQLKPGQSSSGLPGSSCVANYPQFFGAGLTTVAESRKQLFRLDFEGLVKIPVPATAIPFYIGFNANISQHTVGASGLDHGYAPPDDIRILFGTKIDMGTLLSTLKLGAN